MSGSLLSFSILDFFIFRFSHPLSLLLTDFLDFHFSGRERQRERELFLLPSIPRKWRRGDLSFSVDDSFGRGE